MKRNHILKEIPVECFSATKFRFSHYEDSLTLFAGKSFNSSAVYILQIPIPMQA